MWQRYSQQDLIHSGLGGGQSKRAQALTKEKKKAVTTSQLGLTLFSLYYYYFFFSFLATRQRVPLRFLCISTRSGAVTEMTQGRITEQKNHN